ncbi:crooked neck-like protein 1 [Cyclopterus lumpus]|nr:crooked neck-like protein 1 [Cyclopterus lumpus]XP_034383898.1 crooked neck-like protein 1 [Cyclopterus lumpus]XP_034384223.1 crooked neck-like protein 1 [Cyclopterus lumpus]XP_034384224.1 crooked neck-like protein 1 [Cyclopterus lumpus]
MRNCEEKEERLMLLESWRDFEREFGSESSMERVRKLLPDKVKKRRKLTAEDGSDAGWEEYYDYIFPEDAANQPNLKLLAMAKMWKRQQMVDEDGDEDGGNEDRGDEDGGNEGEENGDGGEKSPEEAEETDEPAAAPENRPERNAEETETTGADRDDEGSSSDSDDGGKKKEEEKESKSGEEDKE